MAHVHLYADNGGLTAFVWLLHRTARQHTASDVLCPVAVVAVLAATFTPAPVLITGILATILVASTLLLSARATAATHSA
ncbi:hypothetical protein ABVB69_37185 [Streptomyces sp. NPDC000349]|uniref:hypothetical protein n=1 Tax=Streptomyces sp. NPDC000349 TaxID=3154249 RepID=UPI003369FE31